jgi:anti-sigma factor RsiW
LLVAGTGAGWILRGEFAPPDSDSFVRQAVSAHVVYVGERRHAVEVWAKEERHLVKWLSKRLKHEVKAPYLADAGFRLVGGRLVADEGAPAAQFMYEDKAKTTRHAVYPPNPRRWRPGLQVRRPRRDFGILLDRRAAGIRPAWRNEARGIVETRNDGFETTRTLIFRDGNKTPSKVFT